MLIRELQSEAVNKQSMLIHEHNDKMEVVKKEYSYQQYCLVNGRKHLATLIGGWLSVNAITKKGVPSLNETWIRQDDLVEWLGEPEKIIKP